MSETREEFVDKMPIGWHYIGGRLQYFSREEWEDFWGWNIQGRDEDPNVKAVQEILKAELQEDSA